MPDSETISIDSNFKPTVTMISTSLRRGTSDKEVFMAAQEAMITDEFFVNDAEENDETNEVVYQLLYGKI